MNTPYARSGIHIKPSNEGKFTSYADSHDETVQQAAARVLRNKEDYPAYLVRRANFARNAASWQHGRYGIEADDILKARNGTQAGYPPPLEWMNTIYPMQEFDVPYDKSAGGEEQIPYYPSTPLTTMQAQPLQQPSFNNVYAPTGWNPAIPFSPTAYRQAQQQNETIPKPVPVYDNVPHVMQVNEPEITVQQEADIQPDYGNAQSYFNLVKFNDATVLLRNMVQGPPPAIQSPLTHLPRVKYDRTIFDTQAQQQKEAGLRGMYEARQQLGQASDIQNLMLGYNAQQQQALAGLGNAEREMNMNEALQNTQIAGQEQQLQDQQNLQEALTNYQIQSAAQAAKDRAVEHQLSNINRDVQIETQYGITKAAMDEQAARDKAYRQAQEQIGITGMQMKLENTYKQSPDYQSGLLDAKRQYIEQTGKDIMTQLRADPELSGIIGDADTFTPSQMLEAKQIGATINQYKSNIESLNTTRGQYAKDIDTHTASIASLEQQLSEATTDDDRARIQSDIARTHSLLSSTKSNLSLADSTIASRTRELTEQQNREKWLGKGVSLFNTMYDRSGVADKYDIGYRNKSKAFDLVERLNSLLSR